MQPYLFPYLGYFQLISAVDAFVLYDDVNYIKGGWINRNFILANGDRQLITLPVQGASQNKLINQMEICGSHKILKSLRQSYVKAPFFHVVYPMLEEIFASTERNLVSFLDNQLRCICEYLGLRVQWHISSKLEKDGRLRGQQKVLSICEALGGTHYINPPSGEALYDPLLFQSHGVQLSFIHPRVTPYRQFGSAFVPSLSIIDVMMFNDWEQCVNLVAEYDLD